MSDSIASLSPTLPLPPLPRPPARAPSLSGGPLSDQNRKAEAAKLARDFEGVFAGQVVKIMMESAEVKNGFTGGAGETMFRGILAEQIGNQISHMRGLGIAPAVEAQIIRMQEGSK